MKGASAAQRWWFLSDGAGVSKLARLRSITQTQLLADKGHESVARFIGVCQMEGWFGVEQTGVNPKPRVIEER